MDLSDKIRIVKGLEDFPIGIVTHENLNAKEILMGKASIVLYLSDVFGLGVEKHDALEEALLNALDINAIPNIASVERAFKLSNGFLQDYNKIELIKEKNKSFDNMYRVLDQVISLDLKGNKSK